MSLAVPRPALFNQSNLIARRQELGTNKLCPGITGWAQVNGRDEIALAIKVQLDAEYLKHQSLWFDTQIMLLTVYTVIDRKKIFRIHSLCSQFNP
jgi:O-antigen biosynthesis protein WbqP